MFKWLNKLVSSPTDDSAKTPAEVPGAVGAAGALTTQAGSGNGSPVSRMILLDRAAKIIGYEFALRSGALGSARHAHHDNVAGNVLLVDTVVGMGAQRIAQFREIWLTIEESGLTVELLQAMPASATVVLVRPGGLAATAPETLETVKALRAQGFRFGLAGYVDRAGYLEWLPLIDVVALDIGTLTPEELDSTVKVLREKRADIKVMARRVDSYEEYEYCLTRGFDVFSGKFLSHRETWPPQPQLSPDRARLCTLLNDLRAGAELTDVAAALKLSPELSFRFLRYINSAGMGASNRIGSIEQGVLYLGREKLYRWLTLLLFSGVDGQPTDAALLEQALVRGRMMELLAGGRVPRVQIDELFVTGVFSVLDILLRVPLEMAIRPLQLPVAVTQAILDDDGPYAPYMRLVKASEECESGDDALPTVAAVAECVGLSVDDVNRQHGEAMTWAHEISPGSPS